MSTDGGSEAKYEKILGMLVELKKLAEETDKKVGVLSAVEERKAEEEAAETARREEKKRREVEANRQAVAKIKADEARREEERMRAHYGTPG